MDLSFPSTYFRDEINFRLSFVRRFLIKRLQKEYALYTEEDRLNRECNTLFFELHKMFIERAIFEEAVSRYNLDLHKCKEPNVPIFMPDGTTVNDLPYRIVY